jgi:hypothetical protein
MYPDTVRRVDSKVDVPIGHHYAVIIYKTIHIYHEGDERSRTNPGHGYPAYDEQIASCEHYVTEEKEDFENFVKSLHSKNEKDFIFFEVFALGKLEVKIDVGVNV